MMLALLLLVMLLVLLLVLLVLTLPLPSFEVGQLVQYHSTSYGGWMDAVVKRVADDGAVDLDVRKGAEPSKVRDRTAAAADDEDDGAEDAGQVRSPLAALVLMLVLAVLLVLLVALLLLLLLVVVLLLFLLLPPLLLLLTRVAGALAGGDGAEPAGHWLAGQLLGAALRGGRRGAAGQGT